MTKLHGYKVQSTKNIFYHRRRRWNKDTYDQISTNNQHIIGLSEKSCTWYTENVQTYKNNFNSLPTSLTHSYSSVTKKKQESHMWGMTQCISSRERSQSTKLGATASSSFLTLSDRGRFLKPPPPPALYRRLKGPAGTSRQLPAQRKMM